MAARVRHKHVCDTKCITCVSPPFLRLRQPQLSYCSWKVQSDLDMHSPLKPNKNKGLAQSYSSTTSWTYLSPSLYGWMECSRYRKLASCEPGEYSSQKKTQNCTWYICFWTPLESITPWRRRDLIRAMFTIGEFYNMRYILSVSSSRFIL